MPRSRKFSRAISKRVLGGDPRASDASPPHATGCRDRSVSLG
jgi:hypothetical protein